MAKQSNDSNVSTNVKKTVTQPTYTAEEFAKAPHILDVKSGDIVKAALKSAGKDSYTINEAKKIVNDFAKKGVK